MMTLCMISELNLPTENLRFSLPVCLLSINIPVYRLGFKSTTRVFGTTTNQRYGQNYNTRTPTQASRHVAEVRIQNDTHFGYYISGVFQLIF